MDFFLKIFVLTFFVNLSSGLSPASPYQVSIRLKPQQGNGDGVHLCNGAVIHENYILTTAECMHFQVMGSLGNHPILISLIKVLAGNISDSVSKKIVRSVTSIEFANDYNSITLENDLALLKLNESLPLHNRSDIKWVFLDDTSKYNNSCYASFFNPLLSSNHLFTEPQSVQVIDSWFCAQNGNYSMIKKQDICSSYILTPGTMCNITAVQLKSSEDRGTPLICQGRLVGLLSAISPPEPGYSQNCSQPRKLKAFYTRISKYSSWIYTKIGTNNTISSPTKTNPNYIPPYYVPPTGTDNKNTNTPSNTKGKGGATSKSCSVFSVMIIFLAVINM